MSDLAAQTRSAICLSTPTQVRERDFAVDYLRSFIIVLVIFLHSALAYASFSTFNATRWIDSTAPVVDVSRWPFLDPIVLYLDTFMMSLMFLISGLFTFSALDRKGSKDFFLARLQRLGIPFVIGALVLAPLAFLPAYLLASPPPPLPYLSTFFTSDGWPIGAPWFLWVLLAFNGLVALVNWKAPAVLAKLRRQPTPLVVLLVTLVAFVPLSLVIPSFYWLSLGPFDMQPARIGLYLSYFLLGMALGASQQWRQSRWPKQWSWWFVLGILSFLIYLSLLGNDSPDLVTQTIISVAFAVSCAGTSLGLLGASRKLVRRNYPIFDDLSANAYGLYLIHYAVILWIQFAPLSTAWPAPIKFSVTFIGGLALSWGVSKLIRRIPAVRRVL
jgi:glucans biosynthesis protein C